MCMAMIDTLPVIMISSGELRIHAWTVIAVCQIQRGTQRCCHKVVLSRPAAAASAAVYPWRQSKTCLTSSHILCIFSVPCDAAHPVSSFCLCLQGRLVLYVAVTTMSWWSKMWRMSKKMFEDIFSSLMPDTSYCSSSGLQGEIVEMGLRPIRLRHPPPCHI